MNERGKSPGAEKLLLDQRGEGLSVALPRPAARPDGPPPRLERGDDLSPGSLFGEGEPEDARASPSPDPGGPAGWKPAHRSTGSRGYFGNLGSTAESPHR